VVELDRSFAGNAQGVFGKTSPGGGAYVHTNDVTLSWNSLPDVGYWVCWDTTNNDTCDGGWTPNGSNTTKVLESLGAGTYYWQVKETEEDIQADAGQWWSFTKVTGTTGKLAPLDGTTNHGEDVWVSWSAVADAGYWVCWDTSNNNTCDTGWYPNGASTTKLLEDLSAGTYYWQIKVDPDAGADYETNGGEWWAFTVGSGSPPGSGTSTVTREYVYLGSRLLASIESGTTTTWYHVDVLGSVRAITSSAGATLTRHDYAPFGESTSDLDGDPRRFLGQELDAETALDHFGARQYRNVWGRFTGIDPIFSASARTNPQLWNRYAYALNGPLRYTDANGLDVRVDNDGYHLIRSTIDRNLWQHLQWNSGTGLLTLDGDPFELSLIQDVTFQMLVAMIGSGTMYNFSLTSAPQIGDRILALVDSDGLEISRDWFYRVGDNGREQAYLGAAAAPSPHNEDFEMMIWRERNWFQRLFGLGNNAPRERMFEAFVHEFYGHGYLWEETGGRVGPDHNELFWEHFARVCRGLGITCRSQ
jgi:RHS repeat-associated protein